MLLLVSAGCGFTAVPAHGSRLRRSSPVMVTVDGEVEIGYNGIGCNYG